MSPSHPTNLAVLRILDASMNRAGEGLRVIEDFTRMVLDDAHLSRLAKQLRHDLAAAGDQWPATDRHAARDTLGDVGTQISLPSESTRTDAWQVALASFHRVAQSLRSLEEYGKLLDGSLANQCESLRYRLYTLEKATSLTQSSHQRLARLQLYALVDGSGPLGDSEGTFTQKEGTFAQKIETLIKAGVQIIQLRDKRLSDGQLLEAAKQLAEQTRPAGVVSIVNDRPDLAAAAGVDGVHLGQSDLPVAAARKLLGPCKLIGVSTHAIEQARQAVLDGANYLGAGPTFASTTKSFDTFPGLNYLKQVANEISLPTFAIGGIDHQNLPQVLATGITRIAVSGAIAGQRNLAEEVAGLRAVLEG